MSTEKEKTVFHFYDLVPYEDGSNPITRRQERERERLRKQKAKPTKVVSWKAALMPEPDQR